MQVASMPLGFVSTQVPLISHSKRSAKLPLFQKAAAVVVIVNLACIKDRKERGVCMDELSIQTNAPSPLLPESSVQKGGAYI